MSTPSSTTLVLNFVIDPIVSTVERGPLGLRYGGTFDRLEIGMTGSTQSDTLYAYSGPANWPTYNAAHPTASLTVTNSLIGGQGDDRLFSSVGLKGLSPDQILLYHHSDTLNGGEGNDTYTLSHIDVSIIETSGTDTVRLTQSYLDHLGTNIVFLSTFAGVENLTVLGALDLKVHGTDADNFIVGGDGNETLYGGNLGNDAIWGKGGNDSLTGGDGDGSFYGGRGDDVVNAEGGQDTVDGGVGADKIYSGIGNDRVLGGEGNDSVFGGTGDDTLRGDTGDDELSAGDGNNILSGGAGGDYLDAGNGNDTLRGGEGNNFVSSGEGNDFLSGGSANDTLSAGGGNDTIYAVDGGVDSLFGNNGDDLYVVAGTRFTLFESSGAGTGTDTVASTSLSLTSADYANVEVLRLVGTADLNLTGGYATTLIGNDGVNTITAGSLSSYMSGEGGSDTLNGGIGNDTLYGGAGDTDFLYGNAGNDFLQGGAGFDILYGGAGDDTICGNFDNIPDWLFGDAGADVFVFGIEDNGTDLYHVYVDFIGGFVDGVDRIDLSALGLQSLSTFAQGGFLGGNRPSAVISQVENATYIYFDFDGDRTIDRSVEVNGNHNLFTAGAIIL